MSQKKTILIVIEYYLPGTKTGGPVRSVSNLVDWLGDEFEFRILTYNHDKGESEAYPNIEPDKWYPVGKAQVRYLAPQETGLFKLGQIIRETPHDLLQLESVLANTSIQALVLRRLGLLKAVPILLPPRGHLGQGALGQKSTKKAVFLRIVKLLRLYQGLNWYATSEGERDDIIQHFRQGEAASIYVIPNLPIRIIQVGEYVKLTKRPGYLRMVFLSRISRKKNIHFALETLRDLEGEIEFDIYGPLEDETYWQECQQISRELPRNIQVRYCGVVPFDQTIGVMSQYHLFYLPTLHENYGHVILEALSAGCPVLISDQTPWKGLEEHGAGWALPLDRISDFENAMKMMLSLDEEQYQDKIGKVYRYREKYLQMEKTLEKLKQCLIEILAESST